MTILVGRRSYWVITLGAAALVAAIGVAAHSALASANTEQARLSGERLLFAGVVAAAFLAASAVAAYLRSVSVTRTLRKLSEMSRSTGASPAAGLLRLGELGESMIRLYDQQLSLGVKKSDKISALSALAEQLLATQKNAIAVVDLSGKVTFVSPALLEKLDRSQSEVVGEPVDAVVPDMNIEEAHRHFDRERSMVVRELDLGSFTIGPIYSRSGDLAYSICVLGRVELPSRSHAEAPSGVKQKKRRFWRSH